MATSTTLAPRPRYVQSKHVLFALYGFMMIVVWISRDRLLLDPTSWLRQRYAPVSWLVILHGFPGTIALFLGIFQFSSRIRQRYLQVHRLMGRIYVVCAAISAPIGILIAIKLAVPTIVPESVILVSGWLLCTGTALYCVRTGRIQQHREWMMRGYPFLAVFVVVRAILAIPAIAATGWLGVASVVWSVLALAGFLPSILIEWQKLATSKRVANPQAAGV